MTGSAGVYVVGEVSRFLDDQINFGNKDLFIQKYDTAGNEIWTRQFGSEEFDRMDSISINNQDIWVAGSTFGKFLPDLVFHGQEDVIVSKLIELAAFDNMLNLTTPTDLTVECDGSTLTTDTGFATASGVDPFFKFHYSDSLLDGNTPTEFTIQRTWTVKDSFLNSVSDIQIITGTDTIPPVISVQNITASALPGQEASDVNLGIPILSDNCDSAPTASNDAPSSFPQGETLVTWTAVDSSGNEATSIQKVSIKPVFPSQFTSSPPDIDGKLAFGEWSLAERISIPHGYISFFHDNIRLYILLNLLEDTTFDFEDSFSLTFDANQDSVIDSNLDKNYELVTIGESSMRYKFYTGPDSFSSFIPKTFSSLGSGFGCFYADGSKFINFQTFSEQCNSHKIWEFGIDLDEIGAESGGLARIGIGALSTTPSFSVEVPQGFKNDFTELLTIDLEPSPVPMSPNISNSPFTLSLFPHEVTQAIQTSHNSLPLVEGKQTVARVFVNSDGPSLQLSKVFLYGTKQSQDLPGSPLAMQHTIPSGFPDREKTGDTANFVLPNTWTSERIILSSAVKDFSGNEDGPDGFFFDFNPVEVPVVWVIPTNLGTESVPDLPDMLNFASQKNYFKKTFPLSDVDFVIKDWQTLGAVTTGDPEVNPLLLDYYSQVLLAWSFGILFTGEAPFTLPDQIYALTPFGKDGVGGRSSPTWLGKEGVVSWGTQNSVTVFAHEVNHNLDKSSDGTWGRHVGNLTNIAPAYGCGAGGPDPQWPTPPFDDDIRETGFDTNSINTIFESSSDVMSYCGSKWISPYRWMNIFNEFSIPQIQTLQKSSTLSNFGITDVSYISGNVNKDGTGQIDPVLIQPGIASLPIASGQYSIEVLDSNGDVSSSTSFLATFVDVEGEILDVEHFNFQIPYHSEDSKILLKKGNQILDEIVKSENSPSISIVRPNGGEPWEGIQTIEWDAFDVDGDDLRFTIMYTPDDGQSWFPVGTNIKENSFRFDTLILPGGDEAKIRVIATDGFNNSEDESDETFVLTGKPSQVLILSPFENEMFETDQRIFFEAIASDPEDAIISEESFFWFIGDKVFAQGKTTEALLPEGQHVITLKVIDSDDNITSKFLTINVVANSQEDIQMLINEINSFELSKGIKNSLTGPLKEIQRLLDDSNEKNDKAVCGKIDSLLNKVNAQSGKNIDENSATSITNLANTIQEKLTCP